MQHHGVPTRLLDWTYSPYIALYFAAEKTPTESEFFSVWGAHIESLTDARKKCAQKWYGIDSALESPDNFSRLAFGGYFSAATSPTSEGLVIPVLPQFHNLRLSSQQGCFLFNCTPHLTFEDALAEMMETSKTTSWLFRLDFTKALRTEVLKQLMQMNIHPATLFPDLDGLARFLALKNEYSQRTDAPRLRPGDPSR